VRRHDLDDASDAVLVVAIGRWRHDALSEAFRRHSGAVFALARGVLNDAARAEEIVQEARRAELRSADGIALAHAVLVPDGTGYLWSDALPGTAPDRTYQLWAVVGTERISAGVLGPSPQIAPFRIAGEVVALAITEEVAGGVVASENQPVESGLIVEA